VRFVCAIVCAVLLAPRAAAAHPAPFSYLDLELRGSRVEGSLTLHVFDVAHELSLVNPSDLLDAANAERHRAAITGFVERRLSLEAAGDPLAVEWGRIEPAPERSAVRLYFRLNGSIGGSITIRAHLFPYDPVHQTFINVYDEGALKQQAVLSASEEASTYYRGSAQGVLAVVGTFVSAGIHHILIGPDHILFLVGLLLLGGGWWALVRIVTAFTIGHSITLSLAALDIVTPPATLIEPAIALSIVFVGADNLLVGTKGRDVRPWIALGFGLVHGFGFAYVLRQFGLPPEALAWSLFSFNLGVEIGQLLIVVAIAGALMSVRTRSQIAAQRLAFAGSLVVIAAGGYWFVQRVFFAGGA